MPPMQLGGWERMLKVARRIKSSEPQETCFSADQFLILKIDINSMET